MSTEIKPAAEVTIKPGTFQLPSVVNPHQNALAAYTNGLFLPRLSLEGSSSTRVKEDKIPNKSWSITFGKDKFVNMGPKIDVLPLTYRIKAMDIRDSKKIIASFEPESDIFKDIVADAGRKVKKLMFGPEFLLWIPAYGEESKFVTYFMGNPTGRVAAKDVKPFLGDNAKNKPPMPFTMGIQTLKNTEHIWEGPTVLKYSGEFPSFPDMDEAFAQMTKFVNEKGTISDEDLASEEEVEATGRAR